MSIAILVKPTVTTLYLAERDSNHEREEVRRRPLFTTEHDNLTPKEANKYLAGSTSNPNRKDIAHLVTSPDHAAHFERLGANNLDRRAAMTDAVRETMQEFERLTGTKDARYVAVIHLNTKLPHAHILVNKNMTDALTDDAKRLTTYRVNSVCTMPKRANRLCRCRIMRPPQQSLAAAKVSIYAKES